MTLYLMSMGRFIDEEFWCTFRLQSGFSFSQMASKDQFKMLQNLIKLKNLKRLFPILGAIKYGRGLYAAAAYTRIFTVFLIYPTSHFYRYLPM